MGTNDNLSSHPAQEYDSQIRTTIPHYDLFFSHVFELIKVLCPFPNLWLDTGCGTGTMVNKAFEIFPSTNFVLSDPSDAMLDEAKEKLKEFPQERISFLSPATTQNIQWKGKPFDVITAFLSHHYLSVEERIKATQHCRELLKDGGLFITFENITPASPKGIEAGLSMWKEYQISQGKQKDEVIKHLSRFGVEFLPITVQKHLEIMDNCGFSTVELFWFSCMQAGFYSIK
jgi:tRNA (cmo5U34)-methyltransferase